jgi:hypothetical protein
MKCRRSFLLIALVLNNVFPCLFEISNKCKVRKAGPLTEMKPEEIYPSTWAVSGAQNGLSLE